MSEWKEYKLGEIFKLRQGRYVNSDIMSDSYSTEKQYPVFGGNGVRGYVDFYEYEKPQTIITCRGNGCGLIQFLPPRSTITNSSIAFELKDESVEMDFLYYWAKNSDFSEVTSGSAQPQITIGDISSKEILLPPLEEQKAIAEVLSSLDDKIDLLHRQNQTLEKLAESHFRHLFIDNAQDDWEEGKLGDYVTITYGKNLPTNQLLETGYPVFGGNGQIGFFDKFLYSDPQVLVSCRGEASGKVNISLPNSFVTNNSLALVRNKNSKVSFEFLKYYALSYDFSLHVSGSAQPQITIDGLYDAKFLLPPTSILEKFSEITSELEKKKLLNFYQIKNLEKLRDQLLPKLMSGEIRIN